MKILNSLSRFIKSIQLIHSEYIFIQTLLYNVNTVSTGYTTPSYATLDVWIKEVKHYD